MVKAISKKTKEFICKADRDAEVKTIFVIKSLDKATKSECIAFAQKMNIGDDPEMIDFSKFDYAGALEYNTTAFLAGVVEIKNLETDDGIIDVKEIDEDLFEIIPDEILSEVAAEILNISILKKDQAKN